MSWVCVMRMRWCWATWPFRGHEALLSYARSLTADLVLQINFSFLILFSYIKPKQMSVKKSNHVVPSREKGGWAVKKSGSSRMSKSFSTKKDAVVYGRHLSKKEKTELYIHRMDGTIQNRNSYGNDPLPPRDKVH